MTVSAGAWTREDVAGRTCDIFEPEEPAAHGGIVLFLHGYDLVGLADNSHYTAELARRGLRCVAPQGDRCWWTDVVCPAFHAEKTPLDYLTADLVPWVSGRWDVAPPRIALLGIEMGGQGVLQLAYRRPREFPVVAAISPAVDFQNWHGHGLLLDEMFASREDARQATVILQLHPLNWPRHQLVTCDPTDPYWFEGSTRLASKLNSTGIPFESDFETSLGGYSWQYYNRMAEPVLAFIDERLEQDSRRIE